MIDFLGTVDLFAKLVNYASTVTTFLLKQQDLLPIAAGSDSNLQQYP
jgi:hypothetical protein